MFCFSYYFNFLLKKIKFLERHIFNKILFGELSTLSLQATSPLFPFRRENRLFRLIRTLRFRRTFLWATTTTIRDDTACSRECVLTVEQDQPPGYHPGVEGVRPVRLLLVPGFRGRARNRQRRAGRGRAQIGGLRLAVRRYRAIRILFSLFLLRLCNRKKSSTPVRTVAGYVRRRRGRIRLAGWLADSTSPRKFSRRTARSLREKSYRIIHTQRRKKKEIMSLVRSFYREALVVTSLYNFRSMYSSWLIGLLGAPWLHRWDSIIR